MPPFRLLAGLMCWSIMPGLPNDSTPLEETTLEQWRHVLAIDLDGVFLGAKYAVRAMKEKGGSIINVSSIYGIVGSSAQAPYHAAKGGVRLLTKAMAVEMGALGYKIRVNSIHPGLSALIFCAMALSAPLKWARWMARMKRLKR